VLETSTESAADVGTFSRAPLFRDVGRHVLERLALDARRVTLRGGEYLFRSGDAADRLFVVRAGRLRVSVEEEGGARVVRELGPGDALGELALLTGSVRSASVQAVRDSELLALEAGAFDARRSTGPSRPAAPPRSPPSPTARTPCATGSETHDVPATAPER
jgi:CRP-like cAMP-binding protein